MPARMNRDTVLAILRHLLTVAGGSIATNGTLSSSELEQGIGAVLTLAGICWSVLEKRARARAAGATSQPSDPRGQTLPILLACILPAALLFPGCATPGESGGLTPQRVERITRLAVWTTTTAWTIKRPESEPAFRSALRGIDALAAEERWDVTALASALTATGSDTFTGAEGRLIISGTTLLIDTIAGERVDLRNAEYARSVILGAQAGLRLALAGEAAPQ